MIMVIGVIVLDTLGDPKVPSPGMASIIAYEIIAHVDYNGQHALVLVCMMEDKQLSLTQIACQE